jgi:DNA-binding winged helix-turn-helix (wHTH) protein
MRLVFGDCTFDRERRELTRNGLIVTAGPKLLGLLQLLLDARPRALPKQEIHSTLWTDTFVSDATLTSLVADLRDAIGEDARAPRLIRTIHGFGYLFCGDVVTASPAGADGTPVTACRLILGDREIKLPPGVHILGRSGDAAVLVDDVGVSRQHARITVSQDGAMLEDLGSKNGTMLNGHAIEGPARLADGHAIVLGATVLKFRAVATAESTATVTRGTDDPRRTE